VAAPAGQAAQAVLPAILSPKRIDYCAGWRQGNPDSNLLALNWAAEYSKALLVFCEHVSSQNHETEIEKGQPPALRKDNGILLRCRPIRGEDSLVQIANCDSRSGMFSAVHSVYRCGNTKRGSKRVSGC
jgi:hypothetical protein